MTNKELHQKVAERRKRAFRKSLFLNLALLIPPILLTIAIFITTINTYILSLFLIYFVLPMFYTVEKRLRYDLTGIGKPDFSYVDGYKDFFTKNMGGIFGALGAIVMAILIFIFILFILEYAFPAIANCFPEAIPVVDTINDLYMNETTGIENLAEYMIENGAGLTRPMTVLVGVSAYIPLFLLIFYYFNNNLSMHYLSTIVLPDIDKNISASQARGISRIQFGRLIYGHKLKETIFQNWPYYLVFTILYGVILYACTFITTTNFFVMPLVALLAPSLSLFYGFLLDYFCLMNEYAILEESQQLLLSKMPEQTKFSVYQTYCSPNYIHGEESAARGCFVPAPTYRQAHPFSSPFQQNNPFQGNNASSSFQDATSNSFSEGNDKGTAPENGQKDDGPVEKPTGVVIDLSQEDDKENKDK